ncbi:hypothetical protein FB567DRAFT_604135 [Paraphoma chrysanthemicola]|uniref:Uncharacterized protein n=1 Tax=Paraphoma chrysanthemicola TaxID=798071 RepID=A0A8K0R5L9_9PLEO|nr:hypothetical protein FB567DRAFT_604135 [Paraphoma chrysanthemicola]
MSSSRVPIAWCDRSTRMRLGRTTVSPTRPTQADVWGQVISVRERLGTSLRLYCYDDPELSGTLHRISVRKGEVDAATLAIEFFGSAKWQPLAIKRWFTKYPEPPMKEQEAPEPKESKTAERDKISSSATKRRSAANSQSLRPAKKQKVEEEQSNEALHSQGMPQFSPQGLKEVKTRWNDLSNQINEEDIEAMRVVTMSESHTSQPPSAELLKAIRQDSLSQFSILGEYDPKLMWENPRWIEWSSTCRRAEQKEEPTATLSIRDRHKDLLRLITEMDKTARRFKG